MPRTPRELHENAFYHLINRGNNKQLVFRKDLDFHVFLSLLIESKQQHPLPIFGYCLMPNHYHLILQAKKPETVRRFVHWAMTCFSEYSHAEHKTSGHLWQGRYKNFLIDCDQYLVTALRYIEGNPLRAKLVNSCIEWPWSSAKDHWQNRYSGLVDPPPIALPLDWVNFVNMPLTGREIEIVKKKNRGQSPPGGTVPLNIS